MRTWSTCTNVRTSYTCVRTRLPMVRVLTQQCVRMDGRTSGRMYSMAHACSYQTDVQRHCVRTRTYSMAYACSCHTDVPRHCVRTRTYSMAYACSCHTDVPKVVCTDKCTCYLGRTSAVVARTWTQEKWKWLINEWRSVVDDNSANDARPASFQNSSLPSSNAWDMSSRPPSPPPSPSSAAPSRSIA
jgi:hypothetical protein